MPRVFRTRNTRARKRNEYLLHFGRQIAIFKHYFDLFNSNIMVETSDQKQRYILVVEDNSLNREMLTDFVEIMGYEVKSVEFGSQGLESMRVRQPDLVLLDIDMPGMSGLEMLEHLSRDDELKHIPVIIVSGNDDLQTVLAALDSGATDFLSKPFNPRILSVRIRASLEKKDLRDRERDLLKTLEKSYEDLRTAEESRDALTHMIVHDLGNPLAVITMNTEMLQMMSSAGGPLASEALFERLGHITSASSSMGTMIQSMLDVSKIESGQMVVSKEDVKASAFLGDICTRYQSPAEDKNIKIEFRVNEISDTFRADRTLLERMIANIISNAIKYATTADRILLSAFASGNEICIAVEDNGIGIPEEMHDHVFDKFYQIRSQEGGARSGVGLGLSFCKIAAGAMGGDIRVESVSPHGTRFVINLPGD